MFLAHVPDAGSLHLFLMAAQAWNLLRVEAGQSSDLRMYSSDQSAKQTGEIARAAPEHQVSCQPSSCQLSSRPLGRKAAQRAVDYSSATSINVKKMNVA